MTPHSKPTVAKSRKGLKFKSSPPSVRIMAKPHKPKRAMPALTREEHDAKLAKSEARFEAIAAGIETAVTKVQAEAAGIRGEIDHVRDEIRELPRLGAIIWAAAGAAIAVVGLLGLMLAYGADRFDGGAQLSGSSAFTSIEAKQMATKAAAEVQLISQKLDQQQAEWRLVSQKISDFIAAGAIVPPANQPTPPPTQSQ